MTETQPEPVTEPQEPAEPATAPVPTEDPAEERERREESEEIGARGLARANRKFVEALAEDDPGERPEPIEGDEPDEPQEPQEDQSQGRALSEAEIDKRGQKLDAENSRHAKRVGEIMADDAPNLIPCPVCMDGIAGWVFLPEVAQLPPEAITRIRQLIGLPDLTTYKDATFGVQCPDCGGMGEVRTGSLVNGFEITTCETCNKQGWVRTQAYTANGHTDAPVAPLVTGPTVAGPEQADPEIAHLRERGFTVIPPMQPVNP